MPVPRSSLSQLDLFPSEAPELRAETATPIASARRRRAGGVGWHGITAATMLVDWALLGELSPEGRASKVLVAARSPAARAGLRTGDYVLSASPSPTDACSLAELDERRLPPGCDVFVKFHRPSRSRARDLQIVVVRLGKQPEPPVPRPWQRQPKMAHGERVRRDDRSRFEAAMSVHPRIKPLGFRILVRLLRYYDGQHGAFPSYATLARDMRVKRRQTVMEHVACLEWLGIVEVVRGGGRRTQGGFTNLFVLHWPADFGNNVVRLKQRES